MIRYSDTWRRNTENYEKMLPISSKSKQIITKKNTGGVNNLMNFVNKHQGD